MQAAYTTLRYIPCFRKFRNCTRLGRDYITVGSRGKGRSPCAANNCPRTGVCGRNNHGILHLCSSAGRHNFTILPRFSIPTGRLGISFRCDGSKAASCSNGLRLNILPSIGSLSSFISLITCPGGMRCDMGRCSLTSLSLRCTSTQITFTFIKNSNNSKPIGVSGVRIMVASRYRGVRDPGLITMSGGSTILSIGSLTSDIRII